MCELHAWYSLLWATWYIRYRHRVKPTKSILCYLLQYNRIPETDVNDILMQYWEYAFEVVGKQLLTFTDFNPAASRLHSLIFATVAVKKPYCKQNVASYGRQPLREVSPSTGKLKKIIWMSSPLLQDALSAITCCFLETFIKLLSNRLTAVLVCEKYTFGLVFHWDHCWVQNMNRDQRSAKSEVSFYRTAWNADAV